MNGNLLTGVGYFLRGFTMIFQPGLRRFVIVPLAANVVLFSLVGWALYEVIADFYDAAMLTVPEWLQFLSWIITPLLWIIGGLLSGYASTLAVLMLTSPFHSLLAEKVEEWITGESLPALDGLGATLLQVPRAFFQGNSQAALLPADGTGRSYHHHHTGGQCLCSAGMVFIGGLDDELAIHRLSDG